MSEDNIESDETLDVKGLSCPMPMLKTRKAISKLPSGQVLEIQGTDPGTKNDLPGWCAKEGHEFMGTKDCGNFTSFYIKKA